MCTLQEVKDMLYDVKDNTMENQRMYESYNMIPSVATPDLKFSVSRPAIADSLSFVNVMSKEGFVIPLYLGRILGSTVGGAKFVVNPVKFYEFLEQKFRTSYLLRMESHDRTKARVLRVPLTLDYFDYFASEPDSLNLFLMFISLFMFQLSGCPGLFSEDRPVGVYDGISYNNGYMKPLSVTDVCYSFGSVLKISQKINYSLEREKSVVLRDIEKEIETSTVGVETLLEVVKDETLKTGYEPVIINGQIFNIPPCGVCSQVDLKLDILFTSVGEENDKSWKAVTSLNESIFETVQKTKKKAIMMLKIACMAVFYMGVYTCPHLDTVVSILTQVREKKQREVDRFKDENEGDNFCEEFSDFSALLIGVLMMDYGLDYEKAQRLLDGKPVYREEVSEELLGSKFVNVTRRNVFVKKVGDGLTDLISDLMDSRRLVINMKNDWVTYSLFYTKRRYSTIRCPITLVGVKDPVITTSGYVYERSALMEWIRLHETEPLTREAIGIDDIVECYSLRTDNI